MTANEISGHFSNVADGGRVDALSFIDGSTLGTFEVNITKTAVVLSEFRPK